MAKQMSIAWIGTGVMGASMCRHLLDASYCVKVFTRTPAKACSLIDAGAQWCDSIAEATSGVDVVFTMLGMPEEVSAVYFDADGILAHAQKQAVLIDMSTTPPELSRKIAEAALKQGLHALDAPVSGGDVGARQATLSIMVGGEKTILDTHLLLLQCLGKRIVYQGPAGSGQNAKLSNQIVIAGTMIGVCESLLYARRSGLDSAALLAIIRHGAAACWTLDNLAPRILKEDFEPGFMIEHFVKDMGLALAAAKALSLSLPGLTLVDRLYRKAMQHGFAKKGTQALIQILEQENTA